jgi:hypothetical protein
MTFEEQFGEQAVNDIRQKLEEAFKSEKGAFIFIANIDKNRITDAYSQVCGTCVVKEVIRAVDGAKKLNLLSETCKEKLN